MEEKRLAASEELWSWFSSNAGAVEAQMEQGSGGALPPALSQLDSLVGALGEGISWEIGPLDDKLFLAISPGGDAELFRLTKEIVALAEVPDGWVLLPAKPAKDYNRSLVYLGQDVDANRWSFRLRLEEGGGLRVIWGIPSDYGLAIEELGRLGWLVLESELGEEPVIECVVDVEVTLLSSWPADEARRPIHQLWTDVKHHAAQSQGTS